MFICETGVISGRFCHKNGHILHNVPQNVLNWNWLVITVAMPLLNSIEVFVWVVYCGFPTKNIFFSIFDGSTAFFSRCGTQAKFVQLQTLFFRCVTIFYNKKSYLDVGNNFARLGHSHLVLMYDVPVWFSACPLIHVYRRSYPSLRCACGGRAERPQMVYMNDNTSLIHQIKFRHNLNPCAHPRWLVEWSSTLWSIKFWPSIPK